MKILLTVDCCQNQINGVNNSVKILADELKKRGNDVRILALSENLKSQIIDDSYYIPSFNCTMIYPGTRMAFYLDNKIRKEIEKWKPDIIHTQTEFYTYKIAKKLSIKLNIPMVHTLHTMYEDYYRYFSSNEKISKEIIYKIIYSFLKKTNYLIVPSDKVKNKILKYGDITTNIEVIPTGININYYQKNIDENERKILLKKYGIQNDDIILLSVSRIGKEKNIEELIEILRKLIIKNNKFKLMIVGDGPNKKNLEHKVHKENLDKNIIFTGMISFNEIYKYYEIGNIFVSASTSETQGLTYVEALASGLPLVCRNDECLKNIIFDSNGYKYETIEEAVREIISIASDKKKLKNMAKNSAEISNKFSKENFAKKVENEYIKILKIKNIFEK